MYEVTIPRYRVRLYTRGRPNWKVRAAFGFSDNEPIADRSLAKPVPYISWHFLLDAKSDAMLDAKLDVFPSGSCYRSKDSRMKGAHGGQLNL